jgi:hypothetical protein
MTRALSCLIMAGLCLSSVAVAAGGYEGKRILHVDSYHQGNEWNDRIAQAVRETLEGAGVELKVIHLDTKRQSSEAQKGAAALRAKRIIEEFRPDVVTASHDNAAEYLIMPYYKDAELPFVFCGLNWDASVYGLPYSNVTGMVEVSPIPQIINLLTRYADGDRIGCLTEDTPTKRKELEYHKRLFGMEYVERRRARESGILTLGGEHLDLFTEAFQRRLGTTASVEADARFERLFETRPDGTTRLREDVFAEHGITGFIGKHVTIDQDLRRRLVAAFDVLTQYGPAWRTRFINLYVVTPVLGRRTPDRASSLHGSDPGAKRCAHDRRDR